MLLPAFLYENELLESVAALEGGDPPLSEVVRLAGSWRTSKWLAVADESALQGELINLGRVKDYFPGTKPSRVLREMARLFEELTRSGVTLPESIGDFRDRLEAEHDRRALSAIALEARMVLDLWQAWTGEDDAFSSRLAGLRSLAGRIDLPLLVVDTDEFPAYLNDFIGRVAQNPLVQVLRPALGRLGKALDDAWNPKHSGDGAVAGERESFSGYRVVEGDDFEAAAMLALDEILRHKAAGRGDVGVVVYDRVLARRMQALAGERGLAIEDRSGWLSSTLMVGSMLLLYCDLVNGSKAGFEGIEDFVASPGSYANYKLDVVDKAVAELYRLRAKHPALQGDALAGMLMNAESVVLRDLAEEMDSSPMRHSGKLTLYAWISRLIDSTKGRALGSVFRGDLPALGIVQMLSSHLPVLGDLHVRMRYDEFRSWLFELMEDNAIAPNDFRGPVCFVSPNEAWLRSHDALVLLGATADTLPKTPEFEFFNSSLREQLGLPGEQEQIARQKRRLAALLECHRHVSAVWPRTGFDGRKLKESPLLELVRKPCGLQVERLRCPPPSGRGLEFPPAMVSGAAAAGLATDRFRASSYDILMQCPYKYYVTDLLGAGEEMDDSPLSPTAYGKAVHSALERWAAEMHPDSGVGEVGEALGRIAAEVFAEKFGDGMQSRIALAMFERCTGEIARLEMRRREEGWRHRESECKVEAKVDLKDAGHTVLLSGKIDRIDERKGGGGAAELSVTDYKTSAGQSLQKRSKPNGEAPQVALYAYLLEAALGSALGDAGGKVVDCRLVKARRERGGGATEFPVGLEDDYPRRVYDRLKDLLGQIAAGTPLPANGAAETCRSCFAGGMCRRQFWDVSKAKGAAGKAPPTPGKATGCSTS